MEVLGVLVEHESSELLHEELRSRPNLGNIKRIEYKFIRISLSRIHDLNMRSPLNLFALLNSLPEISLGVVGIFTAHLHSFTVCELLLAVLGDEVVLDVDKLSVGVNPFEGVAAVAVVEAPAVGSAMVAEEHEACMVGFGGVGEEVEESVVVQEEVGSVAILGADDVWSLDRVTAEEDGLKSQYRVIGKWRESLTKFRPTRS